MERSCKTCDEFRDVERYPTVIWTWQNSTNAFKKAFATLP